MNYCVCTYFVRDGGRINGRSFIQCRSLQEAKAVETALQGSGEANTHRRATVCATGYSEVGKYIIPLHELKYIKGEVRAAGE